LLRKGYSAVQDQHNRDDPARKGTTLAMQGITGF
jgi:hypothetical protein